MKSLKYNRYLLICWHRYNRVGYDRHSGSSTCLVLFW